MGLLREDMDWGITRDMIKDEKASKYFRDAERRSRAMQNQRTKFHKKFGLISHMQNTYDSREDIFSEGSTQALKRKTRQQTIQRVPDGELTTQYDKNSIEQIEIEYIFKHKILTSEYDGHDMLKNIWRAFSASWDYGYAAIRTGFEKDADGDVRVSWKQIQWNDILPAPDCDFIEEADWYIEREYISRTDLEQLIDCEGNCSDPTYNEDVIKFLLEKGSTDAMDWRSVALADSLQGTSRNESVETWTMYKRGAKEFKTFVPAADAILRTVPNYDPRKDVPIHFMVLEPDPDWPLGCSCIMFTLAQQAFADAFQTVAYDTLLLSINPPIMAYGYNTPPKIRMEPHTLWPMGTNPNSRLDKFPVETTSLTQFGSILQNVSANMMKNLNITDGTVASDAQVMSYSGTPQGVQAQHQDKTIMVNQYQKRVEVFFSEWANHALRSYLDAMNGEHAMTVDEITRRKILDIEESNAPTDPMTGQPDIKDSIIDGDKIRIDFSKLNADRLEFQVRAGSLIQSQKEEERKNIQELIVPISQMLPAVSDANKPAFEENIMRLVMRLCELSDVDISQTTANNINEQLLMQAMQASMEAIQGQQQQINALAGMLNPELAAQAQGAPMPPEGMPQGMPMPEGQPGAAGNTAIPPEGVSAEFPGPAGGAPIPMAPGGEQAIMPPM